MELDKIIRELKHKIGIIEILNEVTESRKLRGLAEDLADIEVLLFERLDELDK